MTPRMLALALLLGLAAVLPARAEMDDAARAQRWADLRQAIFGDRVLSDGAAVVSIDAPARAENAALVPVTLRVDAARSKDVRKLYLVIDDNPSPLAAVFGFGPAGDAREVATRVRVDDYTNLHAVAEMADGTLFVAERFVKAAGGCSAPAGNDPAVALARLGKMKLRFAGTPLPGEPQTAQLLISHPNSSGLQMDQVTRNYIPADFIQQVRIFYAGKAVLTVDSDIALSEDPSLRFAFLPEAAGELKVEVDDSSQRHFQQSWPLGATTE
jgi:sulfur-oxidizing protein SoxY